MKPRVVLAHGGVQYSYQLALALQQADLLQSFFTEFYFFKESWLYQLLNRFPSPRTTATLSYFGRRYYKDLDPKLIHSNPWPEIFQRTIAISVGKKNSSTSQLLHWTNRLFDLAVRTKLDERTFDILIGLCGSTLYSFRRAKALKKVSVLDQHDIHHSLATQLLLEERDLNPEFAVTIPYSRPSHRFLESMEQEMQLADFILVPSTFSLRSHLEAGVSAEKLILLMHATRFPSPNLDFSRRDDAKFRVLFVGQITQRKGIKYLLEAVKRLNHPKIELTLVGPVTGSLEPLMPYQDYFSYSKYTPFGSLQSCFQSADVLVLPSIYDAFGLVALDAMVAGLPVIVSTNTAAGSDVVRDGIDGFVVPIRDVEILQDRIMRLCENDELRVEMGRNAQERVEQFTWNHYLENVAETILRISTGHSIPTAGRLPSATT